MKIEGNMLEGKKERNKNILFLTTQKFGLGFSDIVDNNSNTFMIWISLKVKLDADWWAGFIIRL